MAQRLPLELSSAAAEVRRASPHAPRVHPSRPSCPLVEQTLPSSHARRAHRAKQRSRSGLVLLAAVASMLTLALASCDDGAPVGRSASCRMLCQKLETCDDATDLEGCERSCSEQRVRSQEYLTARALCAEQSSCNLWVTELGAMGEDACDEDGCFLNDCTDDTLSAQSLSGPEHAYCARVVSKLSACDMQVDAEALDAHCVRLFPALSREYLTEMQACIESDCSAVVACLADAGDRYNTDLTLYPIALRAPAKDASITRPLDF